MKAPLCIWSCYYGLGDPEGAILEFEKDGITNIELSYEHSEILQSRGEDVVKTGREFKEFMAEHGIVALQGHLKFPTSFVTNPDEIDGIVKEARLFEAIGIKCAILHCDFMKDVEIDYDERRKLNIEALKTIMKRLEGIDITICLENLGQHTVSIEEILEIINAVGSDKLAICLDTGHLNILKKNTQYEFITRAKDKLRALHLHDNDGSSDQHLLPFARGNVNFPEIVKALREIGYEGEFNFEIPGECHAPKEILHAKVAYVRKMYDYLMKL